MELVDTHCHIQSAGITGGERATRERWAKEPELTGDQLVERAYDAGVTKLICVGCDLEDSRLAVDFANTHERCWASVGIHPHEAKDYVQNQAKLDDLAALADQPKVIAVGECGLDYYYEHSPKDTQIEILRCQIELAAQHDLPMIFHVREAFDDFWRVFDGYQNIRGVLHSFTDSADNLTKALERGLFIGINGIATFTQSEAQLEVYRSAPLNSLLLETDAPFLTPKPYRGSINEPKQLGTIVEFMAGLRDEDREELARATTSNVQRLFGV